MSLRVAAYNRLFRLLLVQLCWDSFILGILVVITNCRIQLSCIRGSRQTLMSSPFGVWGAQYVVLEYTHWQFPLDKLQDPVSGGWCLVSICWVPENSDHHWSTREERLWGFACLILFLLSLFWCDTPLYIGIHQVKTGTELPLLKEFAGRHGGGGMQSRAVGKQEFCQAMRKSFSIFCTSFHCTFQGLYKSLSQTVWSRMVGGTQDVFYPIPLHEVCKFCWCGG